MTYPEFSVKERRRYPRVRIQGTAIVLGVDDCYGRYEIKDLSVGGLRLKGDQPVEIGESIIAVLEVAREPGLVRACGSVIRCHTALENKHNIYVAFEKNTAKSIKRIQQIVGTELERAKQNPTVLVLDKSRRVQGELKKEIMLLGLNVISTGTKQEAAWLLQDSAVFIDVIFLNPVLDDDEGYRFLQFLGAEYPNLQIILFVDGNSLEPGEVDRFSRHAHAVLYPPWTREAIEKTIGL